ncbi:hypothetical protein GCM10011507_27140 [Edaphobacter acidisoli]|uniref:Uncharacterized protein n=1 Tax=Edaphobacter acidisoli TaxID=2040573 RepID=A0A916RZC3_9BACT|nr:hypothetical protein [Edaphobacter acidisoli]GGA74320.1 hypothetical protein GCM10011507_27140 [Edaphobacter acidisoli]
MRWMLSLALPLSTLAWAQTTPPAPAQASSSSISSQLPDAPSAVNSGQEDVVVVAEESFKKTGDGAHSCGIFSSMKVVYFDPRRVNQIPKPCSELVYPYQRFLNTNVAIPMTWQQKGYLALHDLSDPSNLGTIAGISAITIGIDSHTAYGPGWKGYGKIVGVSLAQDATGQFFGVFAIPALVRQDPRYYRMPHASIPRRILYSISRTVISRNDAGDPIPNYASLLTYGINSEISNLYVPGIHPNAESTLARTLTGIATDPANNLLTEFLPDVATRIHIRIIFVQRILNNVAAPDAGS